MKRIVIALIGLSLVLTLAGCFKHNYKIGSGAPDGTIVYESWQHHWVFGLVRPDGQKVIDIEKVCPSGNATIEQEMSFLNGLINALIGFVYSPRTVTIRCDDGSQASIELSADDVARVVNDPEFLGAVSRIVPERLAEARSILDSRHAAVSSLPRKAPAAGGP